MPSDPRRDALQLTDPTAAQRELDFRSWCAATLSTSLDVLVSALNLHRNPVRGRTHIVMCELEYTPRVSWKDITRQFRVKTCGAFVFADAIPDVEEVMHLHAGEGMRLIQEQLDLIATRNTSAIPLLCLQWVPGNYSLIAGECSKIREMATTIDCS